VGIRATASAVTSFPLFGRTASVEDAYDFSLGLKITKITSRVSRNYFERLLYRVIALLSKHPLSSRFIVLCLFKIEIINKKWY
jgi:RNase P protein component